MVTGVIIVLFRRRTEKSYEQGVEEEANRHLKKIMKNLQEESFIDSVDIGMSKILGINEYIFEGIDFLFNSVVGRGNEIAYDEAEKKLRKRLERSNEVLTRGLKRNIVEIFLSIKEVNSIEISFFHLYFFANYFPHYIDVNLDGNFIFTVDELTLEDIIERMESKENKIEFVTFFYSTIFHIDSHKLEMSTYSKIKELFS